MTQPELKEHVYQIIENRIRPRIAPETIAGESGTIQQAVNIALVNIAVLATNQNREVAIDYLYDTQRKLLKGVTRENVSSNAYQCVGNFRTEILAFREMHKLLDEGSNCEAILMRVRHLLETDAKEFDVEPGSQSTPSFEDLMSEHEPDGEANFIKRVVEASQANARKRNA